MLVTRKASKRLHRPHGMQCILSLFVFLLPTVLVLAASVDSKALERRSRRNLRSGSRLQSGPAPATSASQDRRRAIVGGTPANPNSFPAVVFLSDRQDQLSCGGTLISPTVVLTAAHCEVSLLIEAVIGRNSHSSKPSPLFQTDSNNNLERDWGYQRIKVKQEIKHPLYDPTSLSYDIMLLQLEHPPIFDTVEATAAFPFMRLDDSDVLEAIEGSNATAVLPQSRLEFMVDTNNDGNRHIIDNGNQETLMALGWGYTASSRVGIGNPSEHLQQAMLGVIPNEECQLAHEQFLTYEGRIFDDMMCTYASHRDACYGDSGGPIIVPGADPDQHVQVGIISWGEDCADPIFPGVATRVSYGFNWIQQRVCSMDGEDAPDYFECLPDATFSPAPSPMPNPPTVSPAPSIEMALVIVNIHLDLFAKETAWAIVDNETQETMDRRPYGYYQTENEVREEVMLRPGRIYTFTITDVYGDGIVNNGYYQIFAMNGEGETLVDATKFVGRQQQRTFQVPIPVHTRTSMHPSSIPSLQPSTIDLGADEESNDMSCIADGHFCDSDQECCSSNCHGGLCLVSTPSRQRVHSDDKGKELQP